MRFASFILFLNRLVVLRKATTRNNKNSDDAQRSIRYLDNGIKKSLSQINSKDVNEIALSNFPVLINFNFWDLCITIFETSKDPFAFSTRKITQQTACRHI